MIRILPLLLLAACSKDLDDVETDPTDARIPEQDAMAQPDARLQPDARPDARVQPDIRPLPDARRDGPIPDARVDAACEPQGPETCNGLDDDCNGVADDDLVCGELVATRCTLALGLADQADAPADGSARWGDCRIDATPDHLRLPCNYTRGEARFRAVFTDQAIGADHTLGVAFECEPGPVEDWVERSCQLYVGHSTEPEPGDQPTWDPCPEAVGEAGARRCTATAGDTDFHRIDFPGPVDGDDYVAVAFRCGDDQDPTRAAAVQASVEAFLGWGQGRGELRDLDGSESWGACPEQPRVERGEQRCVSTAGDGEFHSIRLEAVPAGRARAFALMLRPRPRD